VHFGKNQKEIQLIMHECSVKMEGVWVKNYFQNEEGEEEEEQEEQEETNETGMKQDEVRRNEFITPTEKM
jgi:hypothetical protein